MHRFRLEMEDVEGIFLSLKEIVLLTLPSTSTQHCGSEAALASGRYVSLCAKACFDQTTVCTVCLHIIRNLETMHD